MLVLQPPQFTHVREYGMCFLYQEMNACFLHAEPELTSLMDVNSLRHDYIMLHLDVLP